MTTDHNNADQTFIITQTHLSEALSQVSLGFWEVNLAEGNAMACTEQCKKNFGWPADEEFSYVDMMSRIIPEDLPQMQAAVALSIRDRTPYFAQYRVRHPDGSLHWIEAQGKVHYQNNMPQQITGTTQDITKTKDLEVLRDELLSVAMHELKTPLSAVKGSLQLLDRYVRPLGDQQIAGITARALGSTDRIHRLLSEMAQPVLAQAKEIILNKVSFDLTLLTQEIADNASLVNEEVKITVYSEGVQNVLADRYRIGQVMTNLLNNAIKYTPEEPVISVFINTDGQFIRVTVVDNGIGIAPEDRSRIFQKFYRSENKRSIDGLGIGLFLCAEIILRHGGTIRVESAGDKGSKFIFMLPLQEISELIIN